MMKRLWNDEAGQGMVEYGLIIALVAIVAMTALGVMGGGIGETFSKITEKLTGSGD